LLEPGLPTNSAVYAAAAGLLKVTAREHTLQAFKHSIHNVHDVEETSPPEWADMFGAGCGEGHIARPRMLLTPSSPAAALGPNQRTLTPGLKGTWMVTGGTGDIGQIIGMWAAHLQGIRNVVLLGRNGMAKGKSMTVLRGSCDVEDSCIIIASCDVAVAEDVSSLQNHPWNSPVGGIVHAGAVVMDASISRQTAHSLRSVYAPKVVGASQLLQESILEPIGEAVFFSSLTAQLGTPGQSNYAAANAALDGQAQIASHCGVPFNSIMWGPWASGMALKDLKVLQGFQKAGLGALDAVSGLNLLRSVMGSTSTVPSVVGASIAWDTLLHGRASVPMIFAEFTAAEEASDVHRKKLGLKQQFRIAVDARSSALMVGPAIEATVAEVVEGMLGHAISVNQPFMEAGIDSLGMSCLE